MIVELWHCIIRKLVHLTRWDRWGLQLEVSVGWPWPLPLARWWCCICWTNSLVPESMKDVTIQDSLFTLVHLTWTNRWVTAKFHKEYKNIKNRKNDASREYGGSKSSGSSNAWSKAPGGQLLKLMLRDQITFQCHPSPLWLCMPVRITTARAQSSLSLPAPLLLLHTDPQNKLHFFIVIESYSVSSNTSGAHFDKGSDSPVNMLSSTNTLPLTMIQSAGMNPFGVIFIRSPGTRLLWGTEVQEMLLLPPPTSQRLQVTHASRPVKARISRRDLTKLRKEKWRRELWFCQKFS